MAYNTRAAYGDSAFSIWAPREWIGWPENIGLPNFGVGRLLTRERFAYTFSGEPTYYRITRVKVDCTRQGLDKGEAWGIPTVRGYTREGHKGHGEAIGSAWKREWKLIRKSEEVEFCAFTPKETDYHKVPTHAKVPPLLAEMLTRTQHAQGVAVSEDGPMLMKLKIQTGLRNRAYQMPNEITVADDAMHIDV